MSLSQVFLALLGFVVLCSVIITFIGMILAKKGKIFLEKKQEQLTQSFNRAKKEEK